MASRPKQTARKAVGGRAPRGHFVAGRSKQTARKSAGGWAPRHALASAESDINRKDLQLADGHGAWAKQRELEESEESESEDASDSDSCPDALGLRDALARSLSGSSQPAQTIAVGGVAKLLPCMPGLQLVGIPERISLPINSATAAAISQVHCTHSTVARCIWRHPSSSFRILLGSHPLASLSRSVRRSLGSSQRR